MVNRPPEREYIRLMQSGDPAGFDWIFESYHQKIYHYALGFVRSREVAEEITSSVLLKIWLNRDSIDPEKSFSGLIFKMTKNLTISYLRKVARSQSLRDEFLERMAPENRSSLEEAIVLDEYMELTNRAIKQLPPRCRQIYDMHAKECLDNQSIAERLQISPHTVKAHLLKASNTIKSYLVMHSDIVFVLLLSFIQF